METIQSTLETKFKSAIKAAFDIEADPLLTASQNPQFGDYQSNAAMGLAKTLSAAGNKTNPRAVAEQILGKLDLRDMVDQPLTARDIAGPGFINVKLSTKWLAARCATIANDERLGIPLAASRKKTVVDYSGPNVAKQMHVGHLRSTIIGDAISRILEAQGHEVVRQNHVGDWGTQFGRVMLALWYEASAEATGAREQLERWIATAKKIAKKELPEGDLESLIAEIVPVHQAWIDTDENGTRFFDGYLENQFPALDRLEELYTFASAITDNKFAETFSIHNPRYGVTKSLKALPSYIATFVQNPEKESNAQEKFAHTRATEVTLRECNEIYSRLSVKLTPNDVRGESKYSDDLADVVHELLTRKIARTSDDAVAVFVDGDEKPPLVIQKADGGFLYGTTDLAAIRYRVTKLGAKHIIYTHDSRQANHFRQVFDTARKIGWAGPDVQLDYAPFGTMLGEDGKPFKTRSGDTVKLKDLLDEAEERGYEVAKAKSADRQTDVGEVELKSIGRAIGIGALKYADLSKDRISDYVFSWNKMLAMEGNTGPYMQYAYARTQSIFRRGGVQGSGFRVQELRDPYELTLAKQILRAGEVIDLVAHDLKPHLLCTYLYDLATKFSSFFENCPVLQSEEPTRSSRLALCDLTARTLALGLDLLGIEHPERM